MFNWSLIYLRILYRYKSRKNLLSSVYFLWLLETILSGALTVRATTGEFHIFTGTLAISHSPASAM